MNKGTQTSTENSHKQRKCPQFHDSAFKALMEAWYTSKKPTLLMLDVAYECHVRKALNAKT